MPASPSFPSGTRGSRWKRRRRDSNPSSSRNKQPPFKDDNNDSDNEDNNNANDLDDDADVNNNNNSEGPEDSNPNPNPNPNPSSGSGVVRTRETEVVDGGGVRISEFPLAVARAVNRPHSSVLALVAAERANAIGGESVGPGGRESSRFRLENVSYGQLQALSTVPADSLGLLSPVEREREEAGEGERDGERAASVMPTPPSIIEGSGVVKRFGGRVHVLPMHSDWFSPSTVHRLERQVVPHFFSGKSADHTPEKYMECRNHIVAKYMDDPTKRLTIFDCRGSFRGIQDDDLGRIFRFLDHWGIINYCAATPRERESWNSSAYLKEDQNGEVHVPAASLKSIDSLIKFEKPKCQQEAADMYKASLPKSDSADLDSRIREHLSENHCSHCSRPLLVVYFRSLKEADVYLCNDCFHEGRFVVGHSSIDFVRFDSMKTYDDIDGESWTDQETLSLLEGMELYPENWSEIAEHVGTKSKAQCILHFLRLPMEDGLLKNVEVPEVSPSLTVINGNDQTSTFFNSNGNVEGTHLRDVETASRLPFANSGNPVMSLVSFLASAVAPRVAAAAAHAALGVLCAEDCLNESGNKLPLDRINSGMAEDNIQHKGSGDLSNTNASAITAEKVTAAAKAGLVAAAMKAKLFADHEEREIQRLSANIINNQLKRLELKLKQFAEIETLLMKECEQVEKTRQRFTTERVRITSSRFGAGGVTSEGTSSSSGVNNMSNNNSRQGLASPSSQQNASGFAAANQASYPGMPFMQQRQQMFPHGPRLPLSAINTSAAASASAAPSSGAMFSAPGNAQPNLNHPMMRSLSGTNSSLG